MSELRMPNLFEVISIAIGSLVLIACLYWYTLRRSRSSSSFERTVSIFSTFKDTAAAFPGNSTPSSQPAPPNFKPAPDLVNLNKDTTGGDSITVKANYQTYFGDDNEEGGDEEWPNPSPSEPLRNKRLETTIAPSASAATITDDDGWSDV